MTGSNQNKILYLQLTNIFTCVQHNNYWDKVIYVNSLKPTFYISNIFESTSPIWIKQTAIKKNINCRYKFWHVSFKKCVVYVNNLLVYFV